MQNYFLIYAGETSFECRKLWNKSTLADSQFQEVKAKRLVNTISYLKIYRVNYDEFSISFDQ